jgi:hypothetical protein
MPFFSRQPMAHQMPLTPPDYMTNYGSNTDNMNYQYQAPIGHGYNAPEKRSYGYMDSYGSQPTLPPAQSLGYSSNMLYHHHQQQQQQQQQPVRHHQQPSHHSQHMMPSPVSGQPAMVHSMYAPPAQIDRHVRLPEIHMKDVPNHHHYRHQAPQHRPKPEAPREEKVVGGVSAHLDYEMDQMADFVHQMVIRVLSPTLSNLPAFRKFVLQILSSTRLPSSTILLGLHNLSVRPAGLPGISPYELQDQDVRRLLTLSLLLASKFLDDNTFQNKSWAEVTGLPIGELNALEISWLSGIGWKLHIHPDDPKGFALWVNLWNGFRSGSSHTSARILSPIETNIVPSLPSPSHFSPYYMPPYASAQLPSAISDRSSAHVSHSSMHYDPWSYPPKLSNDQSPMSAPETGPPTPEYYGHPGVWGGAMPMASFASRAPQPIHPAQLAPPPLQQPQPLYSQPQAYASSLSCWHNVACNCNVCARSKELFFPISGASGQHAFA